MNIICLKEQNSLYEQAVRLYIRVYSDPPYNELFEYEQTFADLKQYLDNGLFLVAIKENTVIGFLMTSNGYLCDSDLTKKLADAGVFGQGVAAVGEQGGVNAVVA